MPDVPCLSAQQFSNLLVTELPVYTDTILRDIRPTDGFLGHISTGQWDAFSGVQQTQDRFRNVKANVSKKWEDVSDAAIGACTANGPCDTPMNEIGWGWDRLVFGQQKQSWKSDLLCFDQIISATKAVEHIEQIVSEILRPATSDIGSFYVRKKALELAGNKLLANATMSTFTFAWVTVGNEEIYADVNALPTSKLTPEMIQRQLPKMRGIGYFGKWTNDPFWGGYQEFAELVTDDDTCWDMDKIALNSNIAGMFRFQQWDAAHKYYEYGMGGQIGNFMTHVDPFCLRFNKVTSTRLQLVLPYKNGAAFVGIGSDWNDDYNNAQYQISFIWHRFAWELMVQQMESVNPMMPFIVRGLNGTWQFAMHDLGQDCNGNAIANFRGNKGFFWADWRLAGKPLHTEWLTAILHMREPKVIYTVAPCAADPGYPTQNYNSANASCDGVYTFEPDADGDGHYVVDANSTTCNDNPLANGAIDAASIADLVTALNNDAALGAIGTWSAWGTNGIQVSGATCEPIIPWVV